MNSAASEAACNEGAVGISPSGEVEVETDSEVASPPSLTLAHALLQLCPLNAMTIFVSFPKSIGIACSPSV
jgi:hypothetical protein